MVMKWTRAAMPSHAGLHEGAAVGTSGKQSPSGKLGSLDLIIIRHSFADSAADSGPAR
jgi:hypothetical protein